MRRDGLIGLRDALAERHVSSREVVTATLAAIEREADLGAFLTVDPEGALAAADAADRRLASGETAPLLGVPIGVKDLHETRGLRTTYGSLAFRDNVPAEDCIPVERLRAAGAVIVGKTNTPAFGLLGETKNRLGPEARNPCDRSLTTGGSSGGSAAAVAAGLIPGATGTDSAGSITAPSSMCGTFGIKPTLGRIPTWPIPDDSMLFLTHGPIAATVADAVALLEVMAGHDSRDPMAVRAPLPDLAGRAGRGRRRVAARRPAGGVERDARLLRRRRRRSRHHRGDDPHPGRPRAPSWRRRRRRSSTRWSCTSRSSVSTRAAARCPCWIPTTSSRRAPRRRRAIPALTAEEHVGLMARLWRFRSGLADFFTDHDVLITPATATAAFPVGEPPSRIGGVDVEPGWMTFMPFSSPWNLGTHPTASVPAGVTADGRPVGAMIVAPPGREDLVIRVAAAFEHAQPWPVPAGVYP